jgi:hypothetical protein
MEMCTLFVDRSNINIELKNSSRKRSVSGNSSFNNEMMIENSPWEISFSKLLVNQGPKH